jgi:hypothetical protein
MPTIGMAVDISTLIDATIANNTDQMIEIGRSLLQRGAPAAELLGRAGITAAHADPDGQTILMLDALAAFSRWCLSFPPLTSQEPPNHERELPLLVQGLLSARPALQAGINVTNTYPDPIFPSKLPDDRTVNDEIRDAIDHNNRTRVEQFLLGLHGTGADYRTIEVRTYEGIATIFQDGGHPLQLAVRSYQLLDDVQWSKLTPDILHWLTPHLPLQDEQPAWAKIARAYSEDPAHSLTSLRTRLAAPIDENALPLRRVILSNADTPQVCQGVYDALIKGGASPQGVGSVIALAAAAIVEAVNDGDRGVFIQAAHGLLFAAATRLVFKRVQDVEALPLLFISAAYINALFKEFNQPTSQQGAGVIPSTPFGSGLISSSMLESLKDQIRAQDLDGAFATARRYLRLGNDPRALFATIGLAIAHADATADQGHSLQIVQAAGEEFMAWPADLASTSPDAFLHIALRAAAFAPQHNLADDL